MTEEQEFQNYHLPKPCKFCSQPAGYAPIDAQSETNRLCVYFCHTCNAEYVYFRDNKIISESLYTGINNRVYRYTIAYGDIGQIWYVEKPGIPGAVVNKGMKLLKSFNPGKNCDTTPILTPQNVNEKLRTWLVFL